MTANYAGRTPSLGGPATDIVPVTPSDGADLATPALALKIETGGTVKLRTPGGGATTRTVVVADGELLPVMATRVLATGTTATGIHALVLA